MLTSLDMPAIKWGGPQCVIDPRAAGTRLADCSTSRLRLRPSQGGGLCGDVGARVDAQQPEHPLLRLGERLIGQLEDCPDRTVPVPKFGQPSVPGLQLPRHHC